MAKKSEIDKILDSMDVAENKPKKGFKLQYLWLLVVIVPLLVWGVIAVLNATLSPETIVYELPEYGVSVNVTLDFNGATAGVNIPKKQCTTGSAIGTLPSPQKSGYAFNGWYCGDMLYTEDTICEVSADFTLTAKWTKTFDESYKPVTIYVDENYKTAYEQYDIGVYDFDNTKTTIKSIHVESGYRVVAYAKDDCKGKSVEFITDTALIDSTISSFKIEEIPAESIKLGTLDAKRQAELLELYAPRIWMADDEEYMPSTVDMSMENLTRTLSDGGYIFNQSLEKENEILDYFYGKLKLAKAYSFCVQKDGGYIDLVYFQYCPYNVGKKVLGTTYGNHIGDWEHVTIRLKTYEENGVTYAKPVIAAVPTHSFKTCVAWDKLEIVEDTQHAVFYSALGSHGMWTTAGSHTYVNAVVVQLKDECSQGIKWDLWEEGKMETYSYDSQTHTGAGLGSSQWLEYFNMDVYNKDSKAVWLWGNRAVEKFVQIEPILSDGPTGPQFKTALNNYYAFG